jgi:hypothetical protein
MADGSHAGRGTSASHITANKLLRPGYLVTDNAADRRTGGCSQKAAAEDVTRDATYNRASGGAFLLMGHPPGATAQANQNRCRNCAD